MDLVNDLSTDVALAVFVEGKLRQKLDAQDAKSFIELLEAELYRIARRNPERENKVRISAYLSH